MNLEQAQEVAQDLVAQMRPYCQRCEIAGSVRRGKEDVKDIEIVCIAKWEIQTYQAGLFGDEETRNVNLLHQWARSLDAAYGAMLQWIKPGTSEIEPWDVKADGKYWRGHLTQQKVNVDVFLCDAETWGYIFMLRTGSAQWNEALARRGLQTGSRYSVEALRGCLEECDVFGRLGIKWVEPQSRFTGANVLPLDTPYEVIR